MSYSCELLCWSGLRFLVRLCTDMGLKEVQDYATKLKKVERMKEIREQVLCLLLLYPAAVLPWQREIKSREHLLKLETAVYKSEGAFGSVSVFRERNYVQCQLLSCWTFCSSLLQYHNLVLIVLFLSYWHIFILFILHFLIFITVLVMLHLFSLFHCNKPVFSFFALAEGEVRKGERCSKPERRQCQQW